MKQLNYNSKKAKSIISRYWNSNNTTLRDCYKRNSIEKETAEQRCRELMTRRGGYDFRIISHNTFGFTCAWQEGTDLRVETPKNSYIIPKIIIAI